MLNRWIECSMVQPVSLYNGLVLNLDDYNELVISGRLPGGRVCMVGHDIPDDASMSTEIPSAAP
jgi:hypothetical protein